MQELTEGQKKYRKYRKTYLLYLKKNKDILSKCINKYRFGGMRQSILERDGYKCVKCGMTNEEHNKKWRRSITIDHINGKGRYSGKPDNRPENLITLCLSCHGVKDGLRTPHHVRTV